MSDIINCRKVLAESMIHYLCEGSGDGEQTDCTRVISLKAKMRENGK